MDFPPKNQLVGARHFFTMLLSDFPGGAKFALSTRSWKDAHVMLQIAQKCASVLERGALDGVPVDSKKFSPYVLSGEAQRRVHRLLRRVFLKEEVGAEAITLVTEEIAACIDCCLAAEELS